MVKRLPSLVTPDLEACKAEWAELRDEHLPVDQFMWDYPSELGVVKEFDNDDAW